MLIERTIWETRTLAIGAARSRAIFAGLRLALGALELAELEARITALEQRHSSEPNADRVLVS